MPGTLNVGGHNIITHSGTSGAGTINLVDQAGNTILTDSGSGMSISTNAVRNYEQQYFIGNGVTTAANTLPAITDSTPYTNTTLVNQIDTSSNPSSSAGYFKFTKTGNYTINWQIKFGEASQPQRYHMSRIFLFTSWSTDTSTWNTTLSHGYSSSIDNVGGNWQRRDTHTHSIQIPISNIDEEVIWLKLEGYSDPTKEISYIQIIRR